MEIDLDLKRQVIDFIETNDVCYFCDLVDGVADLDEMFGEVVENPYFWVHYVESRQTENQIESIEPF